MEKIVIFTSDELKQLISNKEIISNNKITGEKIHYMSEEAFELFNRRFYCVTSEMETLIV